MCCEILELGNSSFSLTIFLDTFEETNSAFGQGHNADFFFLFCNKITNGPISAKPNLNFYICYWASSELTFVQCLLNLSNLTLPVDTLLR